MASSENASAEALSLAAANNHLAIHLHCLLAEEKENVFFSPFSISTAMAMVCCAAEGQTESEMRKVLGYNDAGIEKDNLAVAVERQMSELLESQNGYTLTTANSMLFQHGLDIKEDYKSLLTESFKSFLMAVDFAKDTSKVVEQINDWVKEKTNGMIPTLIQSLNPATVIVLLNAVYFKGSWLKKFNENATSPGKFFNNGVKGKGKTVDMMTMKAEFRYTENDLYQALELPYVGEDIAMIVVLPLAKNGLEAVEASLTPSFISKLCKNMLNSKVKVTMPRFRLDYFKSLVPFFKRLGIQQLFGAAELGGITDSTGLVVSHIIHKAVLEVNEEGSEAAAATMISMVRCIRPVSRDPEFTVDHPFAFFIYDTKSKLILFMGRVEEL